MLIGNKKRYTCVFEASVIYLNEKCLLILTIGSHLKSLTKWTNELNMLPRPDSEDMAAKVRAGMCVRLIEKCVYLALCQAGWSWQPPGSSCECSCPCAEASLPGCR